MLGQLQNGVNRFLLGGIDERAGVDHEDAGAGGIMGQLVSGFAREPQHYLGIDKVLGAPERNKAYFHPIRYLSHVKSL